MWSNAAHLLMVRVKYQRHRGFTFPIPLRVVSEWFEALADLVQMGEAVLKFVPAPQEATARRQMTWLKTLAPSRVIIITHRLVKDLRFYKELEVVNVETEDIQVKVYLR